MPSVEIEADVRGQRDRLRKLRAGIEKWGDKALAMETQRGEGLVRKGLSGPQRPRDFRGPVLVPYPVGRRSNTLHRALRSKRVKRLAYRIYMQLGRARYALAVETGWHARVRVTKRRRKPGQIRRGYVGAGYFEKGIKRLMRKHYANVQQLIWKEIQRHGIE